MVNNLVLSATAQGGPIRRLRLSNVSHWTIGSGRSGRLLFPLLPQRLSSVGPALATPRLEIEATAKRAHASGWVAEGEGGFILWLTGAPQSCLSRISGCWRATSITRVPCYHLPRHSTSAKSGAINWQDRDGRRAPPRGSCQLAKVVALPLQNPGNVFPCDPGPTCAFLLASQATPFSLRSSAAIFCCSGGDPGGRAAKTMRISLARRVGRKGLGALDEKQCPCWLQSRWNRIAKGHGEFEMREAEQWVRVPRRA